jgi:hypothetical protein
MEPPSQKAIGERMDLSRRSVKQDSGVRDEKKVGCFPYHQRCDHTVENAIACCQVDRLNDVDP